MWQNRCHREEDVDGALLVDEEFPHGDAVVRVLRPRGLLHAHVEPEVTWPVLHARGATGRLIGGHRRDVWRLDRGVGEGGAGLVLRGYSKIMDQQLLSF